MSQADNDLFKFKKWKQILDGSYFTDRPRAKIPLILCSNQPPTNENMSENDKNVFLKHLVVVHAKQNKYDSECFNRPVRFIRSMETSDEPLSFEQLASI